MGSHECTTPASIASPWSGHPRQSDQGKWEAISLRADRSAPRRARRLVRRVAEGLPSELVERAELAVSELVSNAVLHGSRPGATLNVMAGVQDGRLRVEVADRGPGPHAASQRLGGYGLEIVHRVSDTVIIDRGPAWRVVAEFGPRPDPT